MTSTNEFSAAALAARLDRLVDGELDEAQRQELLRQLEHDPAGWRRCALAFLEAQAWRGGLRSGLGAAAAPAVSGPPRPAGARRRAVARWLSASVACLVAFGGGWLARGVGQAAAVPETARDAGSPGALVSDQARGAPPAIPPRESDPPLPADEPLLADADDSQTALAGLLNLVYRGGRDAPPQDLAVPIVEGSADSLTWLAARPPAVRASVIRELERRGHRVELQRQFLTVNLKDGRQVVVPVDQVQVKLAGQVYQ